MKYFGCIIILLLFISSGCSSLKSKITSSDLSPDKSNQKVSYTPSKGDSGLQKDNPDYLKDEETEEEEKSAYISDPLQSWNQAMFTVNDRLYFWIMKPVAQGYKTITPEAVRIGVNNFFQNITMPVRLVNCMLQGKVKAAETELGRFLVNSSAGVFGFMDFASENPELKKQDEEDLGQTLATYGIGNGFYIFWPLLGPSTLRDSFGLLGDHFLSPVTYVQSLEATIGISACETVNKISYRIGDYEAIKSAAIDPYQAIRDGYIQYRQGKIKK